MVNKMYARGRAFEYKVRDEFVAKGYFVLRSAGSKTIVDLLALKINQPTLVSNEQGPSVVLIQCGEITPEKEAALKRLAVVTGSNFELRQIPPKRKPNPEYKKKVQAHKSFKRMKVGLKLLS